MAGVIVKASPNNQTTPSLQEGPPASAGLLLIKWNRVKETIRVGSGPFVVPDDPAELWVASFSGDDIWRLRPR